MCIKFEQFGKAIVCSDAAAEAARYGFTAVDRPEGFLVLAIASLGNEITELKSPPEVRTLVISQLYRFSGWVSQMFDWDRTQNAWKRRKLE